MFYYLDIKGQIERIASQTNLFDLPFRAPNTNNIISDIYDGRLYINIVAVNSHYFIFKVSFINLAKVSLKNIFYKAQF